MNRERLKAGHKRDKMFNYALDAEPGPGRDMLLAAAAGLAIEAGRKGVKIAQRRPAAAWVPGYEEVNEHYDTSPATAPPEDAVDPHSLAYWQDMLPTPPDCGDPVDPSAGV